MPRINISCQKLSAFGQTSRQTKTHTNDDLILYGSALASKSHLLLRRLEAPENNSRPSFLSHICAYQSTSHNLVRHLFYISLEIPEVNCGGGYIIREIRLDVHHVIRLGSLCTFPVNRLTKSTVRISMLVIRAYFVDALSVIRPCFGCDQPRL